MYADVHRRLHWIFTGIATVVIILPISLLHETWRKVGLSQCFVKVILEHPILDRLWLDKRGVWLQVRIGFKWIVAELVADVGFRVLNIEVGARVVDRWLFIRTTLLFYQLLASFWRLAGRFATDPKVFHVLLHLVFDTIKSSQEEASLGSACDVVTILLHYLNLSWSISLSGGRQRAIRRVYFWQEWWQFHIRLL